MANFTMVTGFLLMGFSNIWELRVLHAMLFLLIYLVALTGNLLIFTLISLQEHLHSPLYFFLKNLSFSVFCLISATVPKSTANSLSLSYFISLLKCILQLFSVIFFAPSVMSYDHYVTICQPLNYEVITNKEAWVKMAAASWLTGGLFGVLYTVSTFILPFCSSNEIHQFFCDIPSLLRISCSDVHIGLDVTTGVGFSLAILCCIFITVSYGPIFSTVLKIPTAEGRSKAFSSCVPHLFVLMLFITTVAISYLSLPLDTDSNLDLLLSVFYIVVPPTLNPVIYCLRNKDMNTALKKLIA